MDWLNANAGAVQAIAAAATGVLTSILIGVTVFYAVETQTMRKTARDQFNLGQRQFKITEDQFAAGLQPKLAVRVNYDPSRWHTLRYHLKNVGNEPCLLKCCFVHIRLPHKSGLSYIPVRILTLSEVVLVPGDELDGELDFSKECSKAIDEYGSITELFLRVAVFVNCSDLGSTSKHCFCIYACREPSPEYEHIIQLRRGIKMLRCELHNEVIVGQCSS